MLRAPSPVLVVSLLLTLVTLPGCPAPVEGTPMIRVVPGAAARASLIPSRRAAPVDGGEDPSAPAPEGAPGEAEVEGGAGDPP